jgi:hypothetical protein
MCGWTGNPIFASLPALATIFLTLDAVIGPPRSVMNR